MKTTGEKIESLTEINAGDYYISTSRASGRDFLCKVHSVDAGKNAVVESCLPIDYTLRGNTFGSNYWHFFNDGGWDYRWPTEEELKKFGLKQRKVMFHEC